MQESGPPIPNLFLRFIGNSEVIGSGSTGEDGCMSVPFESSWSGESLFITYQMHGYGNGNGGSGMYVSASDSYQTLHIGDFPMDSLPENQYQQTLDCSKCDVYYADDMYEPTTAETASLGAASPLTEHSCSSENSIWGLNCCGYDWATSRCGVQQFFPEFSFLHECGGCVVGNTFEEDREEFPPIAETYDPLGCSTCDKYYPSGDDSGEISLLTNHACTREDQNYDGRWGEHCCAYNWEKDQCWVQEFETGYTNLNEKTSSFLYPCGGKCSTKGKMSSTGLAAIIGGCAMAAVAVLAIVSIYLRKRRSTKHYHSQGTNDNKPPFRNMDPKSNAASTNMDDIASGLRCPQSAHVIDNCNDNIAVAIATPVLNINDGMVQIENASKKNTDASFTSTPMRSERSEHAAHPSPSAPPMSFEHKEM